MTGEQQQGVSPDQSGTILQRGGEELRLNKVADWLTVRFEHPLDQEPMVDRLAALWQATTVRPVAQGQLLAYRVGRQRLESALREARQLPDVRFASHVYELAASPNTYLYLLDQLTVQFTPDCSDDEIAEIADGLALGQPRALENLPATYVFSVQRQATENPIKLANRLMRSVQVLVAEPNVVIATAPDYLPKDTLYSQQWHLHHRGGRNLAINSHIGAERAWDITRGSRSITIAISDDAFDLNHPDLQGAGKIVAPRDLKHRDGLPTPTETYENHGTAVAGLAIAEETGSGVVGVAPGCSLMPIQTTGYLDDESIEQLFDWAVSKGAAVISCSWSPAAVYFPLSLRQRSAINRAATRGRNGKGCVILFSAGNANRPLNGQVRETGWPRNALRGVTQWLGGFAMHPDVITVAACTSLNQKAVYSNWGRNITIAAPSNNARPTMSLPEVGAVETGPPVQTRLEGLGMVTCDRIGTTGYSSGQYTNSFGGTSSACPVAAGVVGLMLSANPHLSAAEVKQILRETADKIVDENRDPQLGLAYGRYDSDGHSLWFGYGKVNAYRAVKASQERLSASRRLTQTISHTNVVTLPLPPANGALQRSSIRVEQSGRLQDIQVYVEIHHGFLGDLSVSLVSPQRKAVLLQGRTLGRQTRLRQTYTFANVPALSLLINQLTRGTWQLQIVDHSKNQEGQLLQWQLKIGV